MHFDKTEDIISFIRSGITPEEVIFFENKPFTETFGVQAKIVRKYSIIIGICEFDRVIMREIYEFFDEIKYGTTMNWIEDEIIAEPEMAMSAIFRYLYHEWNGESYDGQKL
jgi:hypothetical protein